MNKELKRILNAIRNRRFAFEKYYNKRTFFGVSIQVQPLFCSYGQIGYVITSKEFNITYDFEFNKINVEQF